MVIRVGDIVRDLDGLEGCVLGFSRTEKRKKLAHVVWSDQQTVAVRVDTLTFVDRPVPRREALEI